MTAFFQSFLTSPGLSTDSERTAWSIVNIRLSFFSPAHSGSCACSYWNWVWIIVPPAPGKPSSSPGARSAEPTRDAIAFGGPRRISTFPRSVRAPRRNFLSPSLPRGKSSSALATRASKRCRKAFWAVVW